MYQTLMGLACIFLLSNDEIMLAFDEIVKDTGFSF